VPSKEEKNQFVAFMAFKEAIKPVALMTSE
jgi:hypothetical protein